MPGLKFVGAVALIASACVSLIHIAAGMISGKAIGEDLTHFLLFVILLYLIDIENKK